MHGNGRPHRGRPGLDVVVVGGGPAGARAAALLAGRGFQVVLLERGAPGCFKPGAGGMPEGCFARLGLDPDVVECRPRGYRFTVLREGRPFRVLEWPAGSNRASLAFVTVRRARLDEALRVQAAAQGCRVRYQHTAIGWDTEGLLVRDHRGRRERVRAHCYLWANGALGSGARPAGLGFQYRGGRFALAWAAEVEAERDVEKEGPLQFFLDRQRDPFGYFWRFPWRGGYNLGVGTVSASGRRAVRGAFRWWLVRALEGGRYRVLWQRAGVIPVQPAWQLVRGVHLALGDAGGLVNPVNGEGLQYALASAEVAAETVSEALETGRLDRLTDYPRTLWRRRPFLRLGMLAIGLRGLLAFGRRGRRSVYPEMVRVAHLLSCLRGWWSALR